MTRTPTSHPARDARSVRAIVYVKRGPGMSAPLSAMTKEREKTTHREEGVIGGTLSREAIPDHGPRCKERLAKPE